jgi:hypothetical protein
MTKKSTLDHFFKSKHGDAPSSSMAVEELAGRILTLCQSQMTPIEDDGAIDDLIEFVYSNSTQALPNTLTPSMEEQQKYIDFFYHLVLAKTMSQGNERILADFFVYQLWGVLLEQAVHDINRIELVQLNYEDDEGQHSFPLMVIIYLNDDTLDAKDVVNNSLIVRIDGLSQDAPTDSPIIKSSDVNLSKLLDTVDVEVLFAIGDFASSQSFFDELTRYLNPVVKEMTEELEDSVLKMS